MDYQIYQSLIDLKGENVMIIPVMFKQSSPPMKLYPLPPPQKKKSHPLPMLHLPTD